MKNTLFSKKNFLTLFSVFSVLLLFSLACLSVIFVLYRMNVIRFPFDDKANAPIEGNTEVVFPLHDEETLSANFSPSGVAHYEKLIRQIPFSDSFYVKIMVTDSGQGEPSVFTYEIWRYGACYRINRYNAQDEVVYMATCDGKNVQTVDFSTLLVLYYEMNEEYAFEKMIPWPDFEILFSEEHEIFEYSEDEEICIAVCEYPERNVVDETKVSKKTGFILSYKEIQEGKTTVFMETVSIDTDFYFNDYMFAIN